MNVKLNVKRRIIHEEARQKAKEESARIVQAAHTEIDREKAQAKQILCKQVADLALQGVEKIYWN